MDVVDTPTTQMGKGRPDTPIRAFADLVPGLIPLDADRLPGTARPLLDHQGGMTAALERHWGGPMHLVVLGARRTGDVLSRAILLTVGADGPPAELGFIAIRLDALPAALRPVVEGGRIPFGRALAEGGVAFASRPTSFFKLTADRALADLLSSPLGGTLYGRTAELSDADGMILADVVEILAAGGPGPA